MRVLVTGGLGFLGHAVVRQLVDEGHEVTALTSRPDAKSLVVEASTAHADIRDRGALAQVLADVDPEGICHLAALTRVRDSFEDPLSFFDVNVGGTIALLGALKDASRPPTPIVFASTGAVYGPAEGRISEDHPTNPTNPYGASKLGAEQLLGYHAATGAIGVTALRCFNIAGAVDGVGDTDLTRIIPKALAVAAGKAAKLTINGDGSAIREFTHVADIAAAVARAIGTTTPGSSKLYNVGSGIESRMLQVIKAVETVTGREVVREESPAKSEAKILMADSTSARTDLRWSPNQSDLRLIIEDAWRSQLKDIDQSPPNIVTLQS